MTNKEITYKTFAEYFSEENTKLKVEIEQLKEEVNANKLWSDVVEKTLKKEIDKNAKLCEEIEKFKGDKNETKY